MSHSAQRAALRAHTHGPAGAGSPLEGTGIAFILRTKACKVRAEGVLCCVSAGLGLARAGGQAIHPSNGGGGSGASGAAATGARVDSLPLLASQASVSRRQHKKQQALDAKAKLRGCVQACW